MLSRRPRVRQFGELILKYYYKNTLDEVYRLIEDSNSLQLEIHLHFRSVQISAIAKQNLTSLA
jgi:hypothetical protein